MKVYFYKRHAALYAWVMICMCAALIAACAGGGTGGTGVRLYEGTVTAQASGAALEGIEVIIAENNARTATDSEGYYSIEVSERVSPVTFQFRFPTDTTAMLRVDVPSDALAVTADFVVIDEVTVALVNLDFVSDEPTPLPEPTPTRPNSPTSRPQPTQAPTLPTAPPPQATPDESPVPQPPLSPTNQPTTPPTATEEPEAPEPPTAVPTPTSVPLQPTATATSTAVSYQLGDVNCDYALNNMDVTALLLAIDQPELYVQTYPHCDRNLGDVNRDGAVNNFDIDPLLALLGG